MLPLTLHSALGPQGDGTHGFIGSGGRAAVLKIEFVVYQRIFSYLIKY